LGEGAGDVGLLGVRAADLGDLLRVQEARLPELPLGERDRVPLAPLRLLLRRAVGPGVRAHRRMPVPAVGLALEEGRAVAGAGALERFAREARHRAELVARHLEARHPE